MLFLSVMNFLGRCDGFCQVQINKIMLETRRHHELKVTSVLFIFGKGAKSPINYFVVSLM